MKDDLEMLRFRLDRLAAHPPSPTDHEMCGLWLTAIGHLNIEILQMMLPSPETNKGNGSQPIHK